MAKRVSGHVSVRLSFDGTRDAYVCRVSNTQGEGAPIRVIVGYPKVLVGAVDSPESYDNAARAAISFAGVHEYAMYECVNGCHEMVLERKR